MEIDLIIKLGLYIRDLLENITHSSLFTVYRGQGLSQTDFDQLMKTKGGLLSFIELLFLLVNQ